MKINSTINLGGYTATVTIYIDYIRIFFKDEIDCVLFSDKFNGSIVIDNKKFNIYYYDNENMVDIVITNGTEDDFKYVVNTVKDYLKYNNCVNSDKFELDTIDGCTYLTIHSSK